jgi:hypothetical protein
MSNCFKTLCTITGMEEKSLVSLDLHQLNTQALDLGEFTSIQRASSEHDYTSAGVTKGGSFLILANTLM